MKKTISLILCALLITTIFVPAVSAESNETHTEYFDDGSYMTVTYIKPSTGSEDDEDHWENVDNTIEEGSETTSFFHKIIKWFRGILNKIFAKQSKISKTKYCNYFDSNGRLLWSVSLKGDFTYNGKNAVCVNSNITYEIRDKDWNILSYTSDEYENIAKGEFAIRQYKLGVPLKLLEKTLTLTCDKNGNVI